MSGKLCPQCGTRYEGDQRFCSLDGATLVAEQAGESLVGAVLADRYLVSEKLGEGGMGEVYLAEHVRMKRKVAVKVMRKWLTSDPAAIGRFHREAENASQISHPNVAAVYDFGETGDGLVYLAMEYVAGEPLTAILEREKTIDHVRTSDIVSQVADALGAAHVLGILHRDLKPDNVMIGKTRAGTDLVKLLDFGIARVMGRETQHFTSTGLIVGTPDWMSPEQISGDTLDARSDIYSLGLMAFRMLAGEGAFGGGTSQETLLAKMTKAPRHLADVRPDVAWPPSLQQALDKALATDPASRYADAMAFASDFYLGISTLPLTADAEAYLQALSQRSVTPVRGIGTLELTPTRPRTGLTEERTAVRAAAETADAARGAEASPPPDLVRASEANTAPVLALPDDPTTEITPVSSPAEDGAESSAGRGAGLVGRLLGGGRYGRRPLVLGGIAIVTLLVIALSLWRGNQTTGPVAVGLDSLRADSDSIVPPADSTSVAAAPESTVTPDRSPAPAASSSGPSLASLLPRLRTSVFGVSASGGQGAGFLADSGGIVVTGSDVVGQDSVVSVFLDGSRRLLGRVIRVDAASHVAAVLIPMRHCPRCAGLTLAADTATVSAGDALVAVGAPSLGGDRRDVRGTVSSVNTRAIATRLRAGAQQLGAPAFGSDGAVVGVASGIARGTASLTPARSIRQLVAAAARARDSGARAIDSVPPTWAAVPISDDVLKQAARRTVQVIDAFRVRQDPYDVLFMTPQVMAWRKATADLMRQNPDPMNLTASCSAQGTCDPIEKWAHWTEYLTARRVVVAVQVSPAEAPPPALGLLTVLNFRRGNVRSVQLLRNGQPLAPIEGARIYAVPNPEKYPPNRPAYYSGVYVFQPSDFTDPSARFELAITEEGRAGSLTRMPVPSSVIQAVLQDVSPFVRAGR